MPAHRSNSRSPRRSVAGGLRGLFFCVCAVGALLITRNSVAYFDSEEWPAFVVEKLPLASEALEDLWLRALQLHVIAAAIALPGCLVLCSRTVLRRWPRFHRWLGRVVGVDVLFALVPSGAVMAFFATGGVWTTIGFLLTGLIAFVGMVLGIIFARQRRFAAHRHAVWHVVAQLSVAVTSRALLFVFDAVDVDHETAYLTALWLPVVGSALTVELLARRAPLPFLPARWRSHARQTASPLVVPQLAAQPLRLGR